MLKVRSAADACAMRRPRNGSGAVAAVAPAGRRRLVAQARIVEASGAFVIEGLLQQGLPCPGQRAGAGF